jgi:choline-phosphate cytidylyltransferase
MARSRRNLNDSRPDSPESGEGSSDERSIRNPSRGRQGKHVEQ